MSSIKSWPWAGEIRTDSRNNMRFMQKKTIFLKMSSWSSITNHEERIRSFLTEAEETEKTRVRTVCILRT